MTTMHGHSGAVHALLWLQSTCKGWLVSGSSDACHRPDVARAELKQLDYGPLPRAEKYGKMRVRVCVEAPEVRVCGPNQNGCECV